MRALLVAIMLAFYIIIIHSRLASYIVIGILLNVLLWHLLVVLLLRRLIDILWHCIKNWIAILIVRVGIRVRRHLFDLFFIAPS